MRFYSRSFVHGILPGIAASSVLLAFLLPTASRAQEPVSTPPPLETPPPRVQPKAATPAPAPVVDEPAPAPPVAPPPRVHAPKVKPSPTPATDEPVAVVNGSPVYRPLFHSTVEDPVDRALVLQEYRRRGYVLPANAVEQAVKNYTKTGFGEPASLPGKLQERGASFDDYRAFIGEEVRLGAMLSIASKGGRTDAERQQLRTKWIAELHQKATINKPKKP